MTPIPRAALLLGLAGVLPFVALAALVRWLPGGEDLVVARGALTLYAVMILAFMSGCIWAFAARQEDALGYGLSTLPALWGFFVPVLPVYMGWATVSQTHLLLAAGFVVLLGLDIRAARKQQTPPWWLALRVLLTALVVACLIWGGTA